MLTSTFFKSLIILFLIFSKSIFASGDLVYAKNGMVVSASKIASEVGVDVLKNGGNAVDASVAVGFALAVTYPSAGNIGGGGFMVIHLSSGKNTTIEFREKAPALAYKDMLLDENGEYDPEKSLWGWSAAGVPGTVSGLIYALENYGTMSLGEVIQPAIVLAENGFLLEYELAESINRYNEDFNRYQSSKQIFTDEGSPLQTGEKLIQTELGQTLNRIKENGIAGFYDGKTAKIIVHQSRENGGFITSADLMNYEPVEREPVIGIYQGNEIIGMPLPSAGGIGILQALNAFDHYNFSENDFNSSKYIHTLTEIVKYVYADRAAYLGDSDFVDIPIDYLLSNDRAEEIVSQVGETAVPSEIILNSNAFLNESNETTHYSVIDKVGNAVSTTVSINSSYGSRIAVDGAGFLLNNHMDDFTSKVGGKNQFGLIGSAANAIEPGKRMLSSQSPTIVLKNHKPLIVLGSPGGSTIITSVLQVILNVVNFGMDIRDAITAPRFHHQLFPDKIKYEKYGFSEDVRAALIERGHKLEEVNILGRVQGIYFDQENNIFLGSSDKRGFGKALGY